MTTMEEYAKKPVAERIARLERTADELDAAVHGQSDATLSRRPDAKNWSAKEVVCHLRDTEEAFMGRFEQIMSMEEPKFLAVHPDRWAEDRQYMRCDVHDAIAAFRRRRQEAIEYLLKLTPHQLARSGVHVTRGRLTADNVVAMMAWHDDNHLDQLKRALQGRA